MGACLGSCLAQCGCACLDKVCGSCRSKNGSLAPYMALFVLSVVLALVLRYWGQPILINLYIYHIGICDSTKCLGIGGVNRITFALAVFFALHALLTRFVSSCARIDSQSWWAKGALFIVLLVCAWLLPNSFYNVYMHIARVVSAFFLLLQLILLIDFAYTWNADWTSEAKGWNKGVLAVCVLLYGASLAAFVLHLIYFGQGPDSCHLQKFFIGFTFALTALMTAISISPHIGEGGGLLPAAVVTAYSYWLLFSALTSDPSSCNTVSSRSKEFAPLVVGLLLTTASVAYASWSVATNTTLFEHEPLNQNASGSGDVADEERAVATTKDGGADDEEDEEPVDSEKSQDRARLSSRFHMLMTAASMYVCMLLSAWGSEATAEGDGSQSGLNLTNMWIKIVTQWVCIGLYVWTLVAPLVCTDRSFAN